MDAPMRLYLVDRKEFLLDAFKTLLNLDQAIHVVATAREAQAVDFGRQADIFLVSANLGRREALDLLRRLRQRCPKAKVLISGLTQEDGRLLEFIEAGAVGYVLKNEPFQDLVEKIKDLHRNRTVCSNRVARLVYQRTLHLRRQFAALSPQPTHKNGDDIQVTSREKEILELLRRGSSNKEIAANLGISIYTVKNHVHNILEKLKVSRRREAVRLALKTGLISGGGTLRKALGA